MSLRVWLQPFVVGGALAWNLVPTAGAFAQQPAPSQPGTTPSATSSAAAAQDVPTLPETEVVAEPPAPNLAPNFEPFVTPQTVFTSNAFQSPPAEGYFASGATAGSIVAIPNLRFPGTVNTVTEEMIRDQQAISFSDILRDVGGAVQTNGDNLRPDRGRRSASA